MQAMKKNLPLLITGFFGLGVLFGATKLLMEPASHTTREVRDEGADRPRMAPQEEPIAIREVLRSTIEPIRQTDPDAKDARAASKEVERTSKHVGQVEAFRVETRIEGTVMDLAGRPLAGASVTAKRKGAKRRASRARTTDERGRFVFRNLEAGSYELSLSDDRDSIVGPLELAKGQIVAQDLQVESHPALEVQVNDSFGQPLAEVRVRVWGSSGHRVASTDEYGKIHFPHVPAGKYSMRIMKREYQGIWHEVELPESTRSITEVQLRTEIVATR